MYSERKFPVKAYRLGMSAIGGVTRKDRADLQEIVNREYISPFAYENPPLDFLEQEMVNIAERSPVANFLSIPWSNYRFSKGWHLQTMVGFADQHKAEIDQQVFPVEPARKFVEAVLSRAKTLQRQLTIPEQFAIALDIAENSVVGAAIVAHAGSRAIAKQSDTRLSDKLKFTKQEIHHWQDSVATFRAITGDYGKPPGDNYHFFGTFLAGLVSTTNISKKDCVLNPVYGFLYTNMAEITEFLRYKLAGNGDGTTHKETDILGYHLGSFVAEYVLNTNSR